MVRWAIAVEIDLISESWAIPWQQFFWPCHWNLIVKQMLLQKSEEGITNFYILYASFLKKISSKYFSLRYVYGIE